MTSIDEEDAVLTLNPYLSFRSNARQAMEFYQAVLGGELDLNLFSEYPDMGTDPDEGELIMHAQLTTPAGLVLMASDTPAALPYREPAGISVSLSGDDGAYLDRVWSGLADGGTVTMAFDTAPWGGRFGMVTDRFGIDWMLSAD